MVIDGRKIRDEIKEELKKEVAVLKKDLRLAIVLAGENSASLRFIEEKKKFGKEIGIDTRVYKFDEAISTTALREKLAEITSIRQNTGVIIQLPLPPQINTQYILNSVVPEKDIDVLSSRALGDFYVGRSLILPPVVAAVELILIKVGNLVSDFSNKNIVIVGAGRLVGKPLAVWFINHGATVSVLNKNTPDISKFTREADILISGVGKPKFIKADMMRDGVIVIDCGTSVENISTPDVGNLIPKISGDVDFDEAQKKASHITPVPGGVGPITVAMLFSNLVNLAKMK